MSPERKKAKISPINKLVPKKRPIPEPPKKTKPSTDKYVKLSTTASQEEARAMGERVQRGEVKWAYYASENHYYLVIKKES